jgi:hypothetical protein
VRSPARFVCFVGELFFATTVVDFAPIEMFFVLHWYIMEAKEGLMEARRTCVSLCPDVSFLSNFRCI